jgi:hypothetical protein
MDSIQPVQSNDEIQSGQVELESSSSRDCLIEKAKSANRQPPTANPHVYRELGTGNWERRIIFTSYKLHAGGNGDELAKCILVNRK